MAALDWSQCPAVESVPDRAGGAENLEDLSVDEVME